MWRGRRTAWTLQTQGAWRAGRREVAMIRTEGRPIVPFIGSYTRVRGGRWILAWTQGSLMRLFGGF